MHYARDQFEPANLVAASEANSDIFQMVSLWTHSNARKFRDLFGAYICVILIFSLAIMHCPVLHVQSSGLVAIKAINRL